MKKRIILIIGAAVLILSMTITAFALPAAGRGTRAGNGNGIGVCVVTDYCPMADEDGNFLDKETFETNLDKAISDGLINESDRDYYLEKYDYCVTYGGGGMGNCGGCGRGMNYIAP